MRTHWSLRRRLDRWHGQPVQVAAVTTTLRAGTTYGAGGSLSVGVDYQLAGRLVGHEHLVMLVRCVPTAELERLLAIEAPDVVFGGLVDWAEVSWHITAYGGALRLVTSGRITLNGRYAGMVSSMAPLIEYPT